MYKCVYIHIYIHVQIFVCICICIYMYIHMYICTYIYIYTYIHTCIAVNLLICMCMYIPWGTYIPHVYVCVYAHVCICIYVHTSCIYICIYICTYICIFDLHAGVSGTRWVRDITITYWVRVIHEGVMPGIAGFEAWYWCGMSSWHGMFQSVWPQTLELWFILIEFVTLKLLLEFVTFT